MKSILLLTMILASSAVFAEERTLLECGDKFNYVSVSVNDESGEINLFRNSRDRDRAYIDHENENDENRVVVNSYEDLQYTASLHNAKAVVKGDSVEITFADKKATKLSITVEKIKEGVGLSFVSSNQELTDSVLRALAVKDALDELSYYSSRPEACTLNP